MIVLGSTEARTAAQNETALPALNWHPILGMPTHATSYADATTRVLSWASAGQSRYVCVANVHVTMETHDSPEYHAVLAGADLVTPDGMPLVWALRMFGFPDASRVAGLTLTLTILERAAAEGVRVGFYGGTQQTLDRLVRNVPADSRPCR